MMRKRNACFLAMLLAGCASPQEVIDSIVWRQRTVVEHLPAAEQARLLTPAQPVTTTPVAELPAGPLLQLADARRIALRTSPDIHAARARLEAALARIDEARSFFAPQVNLLHSSTRTFSVPARRTRLTSPLAPVSNLPSLTDLTLVDLFGLAVSQVLGRETAITTKNTNSFSDHSTTLTATWTIFDGLVRDARLRATRHDFLASAMSLADAQRLLVRAVDTAYYQVQLGTERLRIAVADEAFSARQLEDAQRRFEAGKITRGDVLNFEVRVQAARASVVAAEGMRDAGRVILAELMALPQAHLPKEFVLAPLAEETLDELAAPDPDAWIERAFIQRPDLAEFDHLRSAKSEQIKMAKGQYSPQLLVNGTWGYERPSNITYSRDDQASGVALEVRWGLYTGGLRTSQLRLARAKWWEASAALERKRLEVSSQVRGAIVDLHNAQEQVRLQRAKLVSAKENRRIVEAEYISGKASLVRLNEAQRDYVEADGELAATRVQLRQVWSDLRTAANDNRIREPKPSENEPSE